MGLYEPKTMNIWLFLRFSRPPGMKSQKNESIEQGVAGYDPQAVAMQSLSLAAKVYSTACGSSPEP